MATPASLTLDQLRRLQWTKLHAGLTEVLATNRFYQHHLAAVSVSKVSSIDDLAQLPLLTKEALLADQAEHPPYGTNLTAPIEQYFRLHQTSGTSGRRLRWLDTPRTWSWVLDCWDTIYAAVGLRANDRLFFPFSFGPFLGFWAAYDGAARRGRFVLPGGGMTSVARLHFLLENSATFVLGTPTYVMHLAAVAESEGIDLANSSVRGLILAGEPGANVPDIRQRLESAWGARVYDHSGMTEIASLGIEYHAHPGKLFLLEEYCVPEFLDPATLEPVAEGELGELVITNLGRWDSPVIRYRTGDLVRWRRDLLANGRPYVYLDGGILSRSDDMLIIKGNNVYPSAIEAVIREFPEVAEYAIEAVTGRGLTRLVIRVEPQPTADGVHLGAAITEAIQNRFYYRPEVHIVESGSLPRYELKAKRFQHQRQSDA